MDKPLSLGKARELIDSGAYGEAYRLLLRVLTLDPDDEEVLWVIVALYEKQGAPAPVARYRVRIAELYASRGRDEEALALLRQALEHHQAPADLRKRIAELQERAGRVDEARRERWLAGEDVALDGAPTVEMLQQRQRARRFDDRLQVELAEALLQAGRVREAVPYFRQAIGIWFFREDTRPLDAPAPPPRRGRGGPIIELSPAETRAVREKVLALIEGELMPGLERARRVVPFWTARRYTGELKFVFDAERVVERLVDEVRRNFALGALQFLDELKRSEHPEGAEVLLRLSEASAVDFLSKAGTGMHCPECRVFHRGEIATVTARERVPAGVITVLNEDFPGNSGYTRVYCPAGHVLCDYQRWIA